MRDSNTPCGHSREEIGLFVYRNPLGPRVDHHPPLQPIGLIDKRSLRCKDLWRLVCGIYSHPALDSSAFAREPSQHQFVPYETDVLWSCLSFLDPSLWTALTPALSHRRGSLDKLFQFFPLIGAHQNNTASPPAYVLIPVTHVIGLFCYHCTWSTLSQWARGLKQYPLPAGEGPGEGF